MLKQRIITALILLPIALCGFFLLEGSGSFALFIGVVVSLGAWEWARLAGFTAQSARVGFTAVAVACAAVSVCTWCPSLAPWVLGGCGDLVGGGDVAGARLTRVPASIGPVLPASC